ncbi:MAG: hypothetical protein ACXWLR_07615, partial [Myxococcales bacterium]
PGERPVGRVEVPILVLGGAGCLYGGMLGAIVFMTVQHFLSGLNPQYWQFWLGLLLVIVVFLGRSSALGAVTSLRARLRGAR